MAGANESGVVIEVPEAEPLVAGWRERHDPTQAQGVPAHITLLYPFMSPEVLERESLDGLRDLATHTPAFDFDLVAVDEFPGVLWLRPEPSATFVELMRRVWAAYPRFPAYGGRYPDPVPHLTVAVVDPGRQAAMRRALEAELTGRLPLTCTAKALTVIGSDAHGRWTPRLRLELGGA